MQSGNNFLGSFRFFYLIINILHCLIPVVTWYLVFRLRQRQEAINLQIKIAFLRRACASFVIGNSTVTIRTLESRSIVVRHLFSYKLSGATDERGTYKAEVTLLSVNLTLRSLSLILILSIKNRRHQAHKNRGEHYGSAVQVNRLNF